MSIETDLNRIATALEEMLKRMASNPATAAAPVTTKVKKDKEPAAVVVAEPEVDPFAQDSAEAEEVTFESLTDLLKLHAKAVGTKLTVALIIKHGADRTTPKMNTIPQANYKACFDEATADLKKIETKGKK